MIQLIGQERGRMAVAHRCQCGSGSRTMLGVRMVQQGDQRVHAVIPADFPGSVNGHHGNMLILIFEQPRYCGSILLCNGMLNFLFLVPKQHRFRCV